MHYLVLNKSVVSQEVIHGKYREAVDWEKMEGSEETPKKKKMTKKTMRKTPAKNLKMKMMTATSDQIIKHRSYPIYADLNTWNQTIFIKSTLVRRIFRKHLWLWSQFICSCWVHLRFPSFVSCSSIANIFLLDFRWFDSSWLINDVSTFGNVSFSNIRSIFSSTIITLNIMIIIWLGRRRKVTEIASFCLNSFHLSHRLHGLLQLITLYFPFSLFCLNFFAKFRLGSFFNLIFFWNSWCMFYFWSFTDFLVLLNSVGCKISTTLSTRCQLHIIFIGLNFNMFTLESVGILYPLEEILVVWLYSVLASEFFET